MSQYAQRTVKKPTLTSTLAPYYCIGKPCAGTVFTHTDLYTLHWVPAVTKLVLYLYSQSIGAILAAFQQPKLWVLFPPLEVIVSVSNHNSCNINTVLNSAHILFPRRFYKQKICSIGHIRTAKLASVLNPAPSFRMIWRQTINQFLLNTFPES